MEPESCPNGPDENRADIDTLRGKIDGLDEKIAEALNERARIVELIGRAKAKSNDIIYKPHRERAVYEHVRDCNVGPLPDKAMKSIFREIISACRALEKPVAVAYLGPSGTFTHWATISQFGESIDYRAVDSLKEVFSEVESGGADYGVVPVENSTEGGIRETLALFLESPLKVCTEIVYEIRLSLMARCPLKDIERVYSKGPVFGQARRWLGENLPDAAQVEVKSTSRAAGLAAEEDGAAAIGFEDLAKEHGLEVLARNIQDQKQNVTRFFVLGHQLSKPTGNDKTAILCSIKDRVGALYDLLDAFKQNGINMTKIESFPSRSQTWNYYFFIDFLGHPEEEKIRVALKNMRSHCEMLRVIGAFPCVTAGEYPDTNKKRRKYYNA